MHVSPILDDLSFLDGEVTSEGGLCAEKRTVLHPAHASPGSAPNSGSWNKAWALELMQEIDDTVAESGVPGTDPIIQAAAARCVEAHRREDLSGIVSACHDILHRLEQTRAYP